MDIFRRFLLWIFRDGSIKHSRKLFFSLLVLLFALGSVYAQSSSFPSDCSGELENDPICRMKYNDPQKITTATEKVLEELINNPAVGIPGCSPSSATISLSQTFVTNTFLALLIMVMAVALLYMVASFMQSPNLFALAKQELNEVIVTSLIALLFGIIILSPTMFGFNLYQKAMNYSYNMLYKISKVSAALITANIGLNAIYTLYIPIGPIKRAMSIQLGPALRPLIDAVSFSLQFLITSYGEWTVFSFLFCFIQKWFLPFFFPLGLFLRAFPQTRGGGNALIGISLSLCRT